MRLNGATYNHSFMGLNWVSLLRYSIADTSVKPFITNKTIQASCFSFMVKNASLDNEGAVSKGAAFSRKLIFKLGSFLNSISAHRFRPCALFSFLYYGRIRLYKKNGTVNK